MRPSPFIWNRSPAMLLIIFLSVSAFPQTKDYYNSLTVDNFREEKRFKDTIDFHQVDRERLNAVLYFITNEIRAKYNLPLLAHSQELENAAGMHSADMVLHDFFSHTNPFNSHRKTPGDRAILAGITNPYIAENIAADFGLQYKSESNVYILGKGMFSYTPDGPPIRPRTYLSLAESLLDRWMHSPEHKKNILAADALQLGCGTFYFVDRQFNDMPSFMATQNFQWFEKIKLQQ
jgi:uncharacterized protein YkwD